MAPHVYARLSGYGLVLIPFAPYRFEALPDGRSLTVTHASPQGTRSARITPGPVAPTVHLEPGTASLDEVVTLSNDGQAGPWRIETRVFTCAWPAGFALASAPDDGPFDLYGPDGSLIYFQGPYPPERVPPTRGLVAPGQTLAGEGEGSGFHWVEVSYPHEGRTWLKRYAFVPLTPEQVLVVTTQAPEQGAARATAAADELAASLRPSS
jgi:hypothetical protein